MKAQDQAEVAAKLEASVLKMDLPPELPRPLDVEHTVAQIEASNEQILKQNEMVSLGKDPIEPKTLMKLEPN